MKLTREGEALLQPVKNAFDMIANAVVSVAVIATAAERAGRMGG